MMFTLERETVEQNVGHRTHAGVLDVVTGLDVGGKVGNLRDVIVTDEREVRNRAD